MEGSKLDMYAFLKILKWLPQKDGWGLKSVIEVHSERVKTSKTEEGVRYYGSRRTGTPAQFAENGSAVISKLKMEAHCVADVIFKEDASLANTGHATENISLFRRLSMNIIKTFDPKRGMTDARRNSMFEPAYLRELLSRLFARNC